MQMLGGVLWEFLRGVSRLLDPVMYVITRLHLILAKQLEQVWVPAWWQPWVIVALWAITLTLAFRLMRGWVRLGSLFLVALVLVKAQGVLPSR